MGIKDKKTKHIKLQPKHRVLSWGKEKIVPQLLISGVWLERSGFKAGDIVTITINQNELIIKNAS